MADLIHVEYERLGSLAAEVKRLSGALDTIKSRINAVRVEQESGADVRIQLPSARFRHIEQSMRSGTTLECLRGIAANAGSLNDYAELLSGHINKAAELFETAERRLVSNFYGLSTPEGLMLGVAQAMGYTLSPAAWTPAMKERLQQMLTGAQIMTEGDITFVVSDTQAFLFDPRGLIGSLTTTVGLSGVKTTAKIYSGLQRAEFESKFGVMDGGLNYKDSLISPDNVLEAAGQYDPKTGKYTEGKQKSGTAIGLFSVGGSVKSGASIIGIDGAYENGGFSAEGGVGVGNAEGHASMKGGIGLYVPADGGSPQPIVGGKVDAGASVSVLNVEGSMSYELCDQVSLGAGGEVTALEAEAEIEGGIGYVDGKVMAYGELSAEANLVEAEVEGKLDLGYVEGKVGAGVTVGVGAHAKGGYNDGVLSFDLGVSVGVGVKVKGEVDISGTIDAIGEGVGNAMKAASQGWNMLYSHFAG